MYIYESPKSVYETNNDHKYGQFHVLNTGVRKTVLSFLKMVDIDRERERQRMGNSI